MLRRIFTLLAPLCLAVTATAQVSFSFDYTYDSNSFFASSSEKTSLEAAGAYVANLINSTSLAAITPSGTDDWIARPFDPRDINTQLSLSNLTVSANTIVVYVGGYALGGGTLGVGGPAGFLGSGSQNWVDTLKYRDNGTFVMTAVGAMTFDTVTSWYFDTDPGTTESFGSQSDFFSVAVHELFHVLGFGINTTWDSLVSSGTFTGAASEAAYGEAVPLNAGEDHWAEGTQSTIYETATVQEAAMDPSITVGTRKYATDLDVAALSDLGYAVTAVPEPAAFAGLIGLVALFVVARRRRSIAA